MSKKNENWPDPMPQTGEHPIADVLEWLQLDRKTFDEKVARLGLPPFQNDRVDMAVLLNAVRRNQKQQEGQNDG